MKKFTFLPWQQYKNPWDAFAVVIVSIATLYIAIGAFLSISVSLGEKIKK